MSTNKKVRILMQQKVQNKQNNIRESSQVKQQIQMMINPKMLRKKTHQKTQQCYRQPQIPQQSQSHNHPQFSLQISQKIQQLHTKMKSFFNIQKRNHQQLITFNIDQLRNDILKLREELLKPKSLQEVQKEKINLMKRKTILLEEMEHISRHIKINKKISTNAKFQYQEIQRQLMTAQATLEKYKKKANMHKTHTQQSILKENSQSDQTIDINTIKTNTEKQSKTNNRKISSFEQQAYHIHITQVSNNQQSSPVTSKPSATLPAIKQRNKQKNFTNTSPLVKKLPFNVLYSLQNTSAINQQGKGIEQKVYMKKNTNTKLLQSKFLQIKVPSSMLSQQSLIQNKEIKFLQQQKRLLRHQIYSKLSQSPNIFNPKKQTSQLGQKYQTIQKLFNKLHHIQSPLVALSPFTSYQQFSQQNPIECIQQVLMQQLRKKHYSKFQQKGYHQGLKSKTHQIRIDLEKVFTNQEKHGFFANFMNKRSLQKLLDFTLKNALLY